MLAGNESKFNRLKFRSPKKGREGGTSTRWKGFEPKVLRPCKYRALFGEAAAPSMGVLTGCTKGPNAQGRPGLGGGGAPGKFDNYCT